MSVDGKTKSPEFNYVWQMSLNATNLDHDLNIRSLMNCFAVTFFYTISCLFNYFTLEHQKIHVRATFNLVNRQLELNVLQDKTEHKSSSNALFVP